LQGKFNSLQSAGLLGSPAAVALGIIGNLVMTVGDRLTHRPDAGLVGGFEGVDRVTASASHCCARTWSKGSSIPDASVRSSLARTVVIRRGVNSYRFVNPILGQ